jgi:hypothetical protein
MLAVFNWTDQPRGRLLRFAEVRLAGGGRYEFKDALRPALPVPVAGDSIDLQLPAHSVRLIRVIDTAIQPAAPSVTVQAPDHAKTGEEVMFACTSDAAGIPALAYRWEFGDGTSARGRQVSHTYTGEGEYGVRLVVDGVDGIPAEYATMIAVGGGETPKPPSRFQQDVGPAP